MYYILNETKQIIAADENLLELCGVTHIDELSSGIIKNEIIFDFKSDETLNIISLNGEKTFNVSKTSLSSLLGNITLVSISTEEETNTYFVPTMDDEINISPPEHAEDSELIDSIINEETTIKESDTLSLIDVSTSEEDITYGDQNTLNDDILNPVDDVSTETSKKEEIDDSALFDLVLDNKEDSPDEELNESDIKSIIKDEPIPFDLKDDTLTLDTLETPNLTEPSDINIDIEEVSRKIGISTDDYNDFLNDFIDTALEFEKDLQSTTEEKKSDAVNTLLHLSDMLHLPVMGGILDKIANADDSEKQQGAIESFYGSLSRITTDISETSESIESEKEGEENLELFEEPKTMQEPLIQEEIKPPKATSAESFGNISLKGIKPKHFDFQLEEAANDLSLPVELIEEFVHDFIDQAHIETQKMLEAYEAGDLDAIQKIGHLLKGASSNLRINALSDTLYKIQFCEDSKNLDVLIKDYWAHFLSFENQINVLSK